MIPVTLPPPVDGAITLNLPALTVRGNYALVVTNPPNLTATVAGKLSVHYPMPVVSAIAPTSLETNDAAQPIEIQGGDFSPETVVTLTAVESGAPLALLISSQSATALTATLPPGLTPGDYSLSVANARDEASVPAGTLTLTAPPPVAVVEPIVPVGPPGDPKVAVATFSASKNDELTFPTGIASKRFGAVYVSDTYGNAIRAIYPNGEISTFTGSGKAGNSNGGRFPACDVQQAHGAGPRFPWQSAGRRHRQRPVEESHPRKA